MSRIGEFLSNLNPFAPADPVVPLDAIVPGAPAGAPAVPFSQAIDLMAQQQPSPQQSADVGLAELLLSLNQPGAMAAIEPPLDVRKVSDKAPKGEHPQLPYLGGIWMDFREPTWRWPVVRRAINSMDMGDFQMAGLLMEELLKDDAQYHGLRTRTMKVMNLRERILPSRKRGGRRAARLLAKYRRLIFPPGILREILKYLYHFRFTICEVVWVKVRNDDDPNGPPYWEIPQLKPWHPSFIFWRATFDKKEALWGSDQIGGNYVLVTSQGVLELTGENAPGAGRFVLFNAGGNRPWLDGILRPSANPVVRRFYVRKDHARFEERHGLGIVKVKFPTYFGAESWEWKAFQQSLSTMGSNGVIMCPRDKENPETGVDAEFIGPPNSAALQSFVLSKKELDLDIYTLWLAQSLTTAAGENGGSHAAVLGMVRKEDELARDDSMAISDAQIDWYTNPQGDETWRMIPSDGVLREQVWRYFAYYNFGDPNCAPYTMWEATPDAQRRDAEELRKVRAGTQQLRALAAQQLGNAISDLNNAKTEHDPGYMFEQIGLRLTRPPEDVEAGDDIGVLERTRAHFRRALLR